MVPPMVRAPGQSLQTTTGKQLVSRPPSSRPSPHGEGETRARFLKTRATGLAGRSTEKSKTRQGGSFSPREKARMRASVKTNFFFHRLPSFVQPKLPLAAAAGV